jgi:hypothetical protein
MASKKRRSSRRSRGGSLKGHSIGHVPRRSGTFVWVTGSGDVREMTPPHRSSRHGDKKRGGKKKKGSRASRKR